MFFVRFVLFIADPWSSIPKTPARYELQVDAQRRRFERCTKRLGNKDAICVVSNFFVGVHSATTSPAPDKTRSIVSTSKSCRQTLAYRIYSSSREKSEQRIIWSTFLKFLPRYRVERLLIQKSSWPATTKRFLRAQYSSDAFQSSRFSQKTVNGFLRKCWVGFVAPSGDLCTTACKTIGVNLRGSVPHALPLTDRRRAATTVPGLDKVLIPKKRHCTTDTSRARRTSPHVKNLWQSIFARPSSAQTKK